MKLYISTAAINKVTVSNSVKGSALAGRRIWSFRALVLLVFVLGILLPFLFVRAAFLLLESSPFCSSSIGCMGWGFLRSGHTSTKFKEELTKALLETKDGTGIESGGMEASFTSFNELVKESTSKRQDIKTFAFNTKALLLRMERLVQSARLRESAYWHLASHGVPKSLHCLCLRLAEEYLVNARARSRLPAPEYVSRLTDPSFHHLVLLTDNVLAASVVISSTVQNSARPDKLVFHIITDKKTYNPMHAWFAINPVESAVVEVKGLHQYHWPHEVNIGVREMLNIHRLVWSHHYSNLKREDFEQEGEYRRHMDVLSPSCLSIMNHHRIYISELFPDLNRIVLLDDDVVVQHDISSLWELDLNGKVVGAVFNSCCGQNYCPGRKYKDYLNFSHPQISSNFDYDRCAWLYGMNILDLEAWRTTNMTRSYLSWMKLNLDSGLALWQPGLLPPVLLALEGNVHPIDASWHLAGLGHGFPKVDREILESAAVVHFSGPAKPWLEIGFPQVRSLWDRHVNFSNNFIRKCRVLG